MKTYQTAAKRFVITKKGKVIKRKAGQDHFNSRESGKVTLMKRQDISLSKPSTRTIKKQMLT